MSEEEHNYITWDDLKVDYHKITKTTITWNGKLVEVETRNIPWGRFNQISVEASKETADDPQSYNRVLQEKLMKEMFVRIAGRECDEQFWNEVDWKIIEAIRIAMFGPDRQLLYDEKLLKNLVRELLEQIESTDSK